jgi:hypothetical protein
MIWAPILALALFVVALALCVLEADGRSRGRK